jgi:hypothetical protein
MSCSACQIVYPIGLSDDGQAPTTFESMVDQFLVESRPSGPNPSSAPHRQTAGVAAHWRCGRAQIAAWRGSLAMRRHRRPSSRPSTRAAAREPIHTRSHGCLPVCLSVCLSFCLLSVCRSVGLSIDVHHRHAHPHAVAGLPRERAITWKGNGGRTAARLPSAALMCSAVRWS